MNWRYIYIASVVGLSYVLFLSWNAEKEIKQEVAEATAISLNNRERILPVGETEDFIEIENSKLIVKISPVTGKIWEARLKEHTYLNNDDSLGVRLFGFDNATGFKFYLNSGFASEGQNFEVVSIQPASVELASIDGNINKSISLKADDYELSIKDVWSGDLPVDLPTPYIAMYRTCLLYTSPSPRDVSTSRMPSSA